MTPRGMQDPQREYMYGIPLPRCPPAAESDAAKTEPASLAYVRVEDYTESAFTYLSVVAKQYIRAGGTVILDAHFCALYFHGEFLADVRACPDAHSLVNPPVNVEHTEEGRKARQRPVLYLTVCQSHDTAVRYRRFLGVQRTCGRPFAFVSLVPANERQIYRTVLEDAKDDDYVDLDHLESCPIMGAVAPTATAAATVPV